MIYGKLYQEACERFGYWPWLLLVVVFVSLVIWRGYEKNSLAEAEKQAAVEACLEAESRVACEAWVEIHHQACFDYNYTGADIYGAPRLDRNGYRECLELGFEDYLAELRQRERDTHAYQKKLLD